MQIDITWAPIFAAIVPSLAIAYMVATDYAYVKENGILRRWKLLAIAINAAVLAFLSIWDMSLGGGTLTMTIIVVFALALFIFAALSTLAFLLYNDI